jgi:predicted RNA-binding protein YlxR (DUF448 family)
MVVRTQNAEDAVAGLQATLRTCAVSRTQRPPEELIRFVAGPDDQMVPDLGRRLPGRGVWVTAEYAVVAEAVKRKAFADLVDRLMVKRCVEALSLANKAGLVTTGFTRVEAELIGGSVAILLHAADAADDGAGKLDRRFIAICGQIGRKPSIVRELTCEQMSLALGRPNVVHAALGAGGATTNFLNEVCRVTRYRSGSQAPDTATAAH